ncbi:MAG: S49 family peptidase [Holosporaceae bacterium]|jgi:signal peptide peptidase SppA|nr:S49 family peptidase [Holosporaceae bacterium]
MIQKMMSKPLMIAPQSLEIISSAEWFESDKKTSAIVHEGTAIIPVLGLLTKSPTFFSSFFGTVSYEEIFEMISSALDDSKINSILLDIDSPGGEVSGLFDLVDFIYESRKIKPIYAIANDCAFSAAYAIASAASKIFVNRTSGVGSIGVIATHIDQSSYDKKEGIKYTTIFAGDKKNDLSPHEPLSDEATADLQKEVNRLYEMFVATVAKNRGVSTAQIRATQAALYFGAESVSLGLADETADFRKCLQITGARLSLDPKINITSNFQITGGNQMNEDIESYKAEVLEIFKLCKLAHAENKLAEFIEQNLSSDQVKEKLLACANTQEEIRSTVYQKEAVQENPVIAAAKARATKQIGG